MTCKEPPGWFTDRVIPAESGWLVIVVSSRFELALGLRLLLGGSVVGSRASCLDAALTAAVSGSTGFIAGVLIAFDPTRTATLDASYEVCVDGRVFAFAVHHGQLAEAEGVPQVRITASAADLVGLRLGADTEQRTRSASRIEVSGAERAIARFRAAFDIPSAGI